MQNETIYKLVTMLGDARTAETELRRENTILQDRFYAFSKANDELMRRIADMEKQIAEYETILKPIRPEDEERLAPWEPIPDNVHGIGCGTYLAPVHLSTDVDGQRVKVESQGNVIVMDLGAMRICCRRGTWAPF